MTKEKIISINIVILFSQLLNNKLIKLSQKIDKYTPSHILLSQLSMIPHLTLYGSNFPSINTEKIIKEISQIAKRTNTFQIKVTSKNIVQGSIFLDVYLSRQLKILHLKTLNQLNPLRDGYYNKNQLSLPGLNKTMIHNLKKYGMTMVKNSYCPHITVSKPKDIKLCNNAINQLPERINFKADVKSISVVQVNDKYGTCKKIIKTLSLAN